MAVSGCGEIFRSFAGGYWDTYEDLSPIAVDGGELTIRLRDAVNEYSGNTIAVQIYYGVRNTSPEDRCFTVMFDPNNASTYGVPARTAIFVPRGGSVAMNGDYWGTRATSELWNYLIPLSTSRSVKSTAADCR